MSQQGVGIATIHESLATLHLALRGIEQLRCSQPLSYHYQCRQHPWDSPRIGTFLPVKRTQNTTDLLLTQHKLELKLLQIPANVSLTKVGSACTCPCS